MSGHPHLKPSLPSSSMLPKFKPTDEPMGSKNQRQEAITPPQTPPHPIYNRGSMIALMCQTNGQMQGYVNYKYSQTTPWQTGFCILSSEGNLWATFEGTRSSVSTMIPDCRGCKTFASYDSSCKSTVLTITSFKSKYAVHLRPSSPELLDYWLAALLCWHTISPGQALCTENQTNLPSPVALTADQQTKRLSAVRNYYHGGSNLVPSAPRSMGLIKESPCKVSGDFTTDFATPTREDRVTDNTNSSITRLVYPYQGVAWRDGHCKLHEDGSLRISFADKKHPHTNVLSLPALSSRSIQYLHESVCNAPFTLSIHHKLSAIEFHGHTTEPIYLHFDSRSLFEDWLMLLRCFTKPEIFGPHITNADSFTLDDSQPGDQVVMAGVYRIRQTLEISVKRIESIYKNRSRSPKAAMNALTVDCNQSTVEDTAPRAYHVQIFLDELPWANRTMTESSSVEDCRMSVFSFYELPSFRPRIRVQFKQVTACATQSSTKHHEGPCRHTKLADQSNDLRNKEYEPTASGTVVIETARFANVEDMQHSVPLMNDTAQVGIALLSISFVEQTILPEFQYDQLSCMVGDLSNNLPTICCQRQPQYAKAFGEIFSNIFQASGNAVEWLLYLMREQLVHDVESSSVRKQISNLKSSRSPTLIQKQVQDFSKITSAGGLYRTTPMLNTSVVAYLERLGKSILQQTLADTIDRVVDEDLDCEVNPSEIGPGGIADVKQNWRQLLDITSNIWTCIYFSASKFPTELKIIFKTLRDCVEVTLAHLKPTITYTSVSSFVIEKFFCMAINNPVKFGLVKRLPSTRVQRTLQLVTRSLNTLASMTTFGPKEPWMSPMNRFNTSHRQQFREFIDKICDLSEADDDLQSRGFSMDEPFLPNLFLSTMSSDLYHCLPASCREDLLNLPFMADLPANLAALVSLCIDASTDQHESTVMPAVTNYDADRTVMERGSNVYSKFQKICRELQNKTHTLRTQSGAVKVTDPAVVNSWASFATRYEANLSQYWDLESFTRPATKDVGDVQRRQDHSYEPKVTAISSDGASKEDSKVVDSARPSSNSGSSRLSWNSARGARDSKKKSSTKSNAEDNALRKLGWA